MGAGFRVQSSCQLWEVMCGRVWGELETVSIEERCVHSDLHTNCGVLLLCHRAEAYLIQGLSQFKQSILYGWVKFKYLIFHPFLRLKYMCLHTCKHTRFSFSLTLYKRKQSTKERRFCVFG